MTISSTNRKAGPFAGNGVTTVFPFTYKVFAAADLRVIKTSTLGVNTDLVLTTNYTVALNADQNVSPGGSVTALVAPATGEKLTIVGNMSSLQPTALISGGGFYPEVIENAFDRCVILVQQLIEKFSRAITIPSTDTSVNMELPTQTVRANKALVFGSDGSVGVSSSNFDDQAGAAAASAAAAAASAAAAAGSVASTSANAATATTQAGIATTQAATATTQAGIATTQAGNAATSATTAANLLDNFDDRYLGVKTVAPTLDNDGNALLNGALYFNSTSNTMFVYSTGLGIWQTITSSTLRSGAGVPSAGTGADGDFYINVTVYDIYGPKTAGAWGTGVSLIGPNGPGTGDVLGQASSIDGEIALFQSTTGKRIKRATISGILKAVSGVLSAATAAVDYVAPGLLTASGLTMTTGKVLGRGTAATGAIEELTLGSHLTITAGVLDAVGSGLIFISPATVVGSPVAAINFLTLFNSTYDDMIVLIDDLSFSAADNLRLRLAVAGSLVTSASYSWGGISIAGALGYVGASPDTTFRLNNQPADPATKYAVTIEFRNINSAGNCSIRTSMQFKENGGAFISYDWDQYSGAMSSGSVISGFGLYLAGGNNIDSGTVRIYGVSKT